MSAYNKRGKGEGEEREAPTHLINLPMLHVLGKTTRYLAKKMAVCVNVTRLFY